MHHSLDMEKSLYVRLYAGCGYTPFAALIVLLVLNAVSKSLRGRKNKRTKQKISPPSRHCIQKSMRWGTIGEESFSERVNNNYCSFSPRIPTTLSMWQKQSRSMPLRQPRRHRLQSAARSGIDHEKHKPIGRASSNRCPISTCAWKTPPSFPRP